MRSGGLREFIIRLMTYRTKNQETRNKTEVESQEPRVKKQDGTPGEVIKNIYNENFRAYRGHQLGVDT